MERLGKYELIRILGEGGMGRVYEAVDPMIGRKVAIKTISLNILNDPDVRSRFLREAQAAGGLSHPNLITIHDVAEQDGHPYIVMEYLEGEDLAQAIVKGQLSLDAKLRLMIEMCQGLAYAHARGVIHRDIKPPNIFLTASGLVKIVDFGLARGAVSEFTQTGKVIGTLNYMAPEQIRSERTDPRADIFSAGVVFYELLSGQKAFEGDSAAATIYKILQLQLMPVHSIDAQLPPRLSQIVSRATEKDRNARYQTIDEMLADIVTLRQEMERGQPGLVDDLESTVRVRTGQTETVHLKSRQTQSRTPSQVPSQTPTPVPAPATVEQSKPDFDWRWAAAAAVIVVVIAAGAFFFGRSSPARQAEIAQSTAQPAPTSPPAPTPSPGVTAPPTAGQPSAATSPSTAIPSPPSSSSAAPARPSAGAQSPAGPPVTRSAGSSNSASTAVTASGRASEAQSTGRESQPAQPARAEPPAAASEIPARGAAESSASRPAEGAGRDSTSSRPPEAPPVRAEAPRSAAPEPAPPPAAPAPPPAAPAAPAASAEAAVQGTLARYKAALESRDLAALKQIWPALVGRQEAAIKTEFDNARSIAVDLDNVNVRVANTAATVTCRRNYVVTTAQGQTLRTASRMTMTLERRNGSWVIDAIRHEVDR